MSTVDNQETDRPVTTTPGGVPFVPAVPAGTADVVQQTTVVEPKDLVRWGPILAGLLTALGMFLLLSMLALAVGLNTVSVGSGQADDAALGGGIVTAILALLSFLVGGYVAGRTAAAVPTAWGGALQVFLVWALGLLLILALAAFGLGTVFGQAGELFGQFRAAGLSADDVNVDPNAVQQGIREGAFPAFIGLALPAITSAIGGWLGSRGRRDRWQHAEGVR